MLAFGIEQRKGNLLTHFNLHVWWLKNGSEKWGGREGEAWERWGREGAVCVIHQIHYSIVQRLIDNTSQNHDLYHRTCITKEKAADTWKCHQWQDPLEVAHYYFLHLSCFSFIFSIPELPIEERCGINCTMLIAVIQGSMQHLFLMGDGQWILNLSLYSVGINETIFSCSSESSHLKLSIGSYGKYF